MEERRVSGNQFVGIETHFTELDGITSGLHRGDLNIIAGRPSMGKTSFAMNIAARIATRHPVFVASLEMPEDQLAMRMLASEALVSLQKVRSGNVTDTESQRLADASAKLIKQRLIIDTRAITPADIRARARRAQREYGQLGVIIVDYLQLVRVPGQDHNRVSEVSAASRLLKELAKELNVPVIALSQLNRTVESRPDKRPVMSDLRDSGAIEQDADLIAFVYRDEVYNERADNRGIAEIIIRKQRNGPVGDVRLMFNATFTRFDNFRESYARAT